LLLGVQISSIRFLCIYFKTKWIDQLKYCPSLPTTFSHLSGNFEFHLKKMTRLWRRSNFGINFRFLQKKWTGDLSNRAASFETINNQKEQCPENTADAVKHPIWAFSNIFFFFSDMRPSVVMKKNNFIMSLLVFCRFSRNARLKQVNCSQYRSPIMESLGFNSS